MTASNDQTDLLAPHRRARMQAARERMNSSGPMEEVDGALILAGIRASRPPESLPRRGRPRGSRTRPRTPDLPMHVQPGNPFIAPGEVVYAPEPVDQGAPNVGQDFQDLEPLPPYTPLEPQFNFGAQPPADWDFTFDPQDFPQPQMVGDMQPEAPVDHFQDEHLLVLAGAYVADPLANLLLTGHFRTNGFAEDNDARGGDQD